MRPGPLIITIGLLLTPAASAAGVISRPPLSTMPQQGDDDLRRLQELAGAARSASPAPSPAASPAAPGPDIRALLDRLDAHGFRINLGAYQTLPESVTRRDLEYLARAADLLAGRNAATFEPWDLAGASPSASPAPGTPPAGDEPLAAPYFTVARRKDLQPLAITLLPAPADLQAADAASIDRRLAEAPRWAAGLYFPPRESDTLTRCAMPAGKPFPPSGRIPPGRIGKVIGRPDDRDVVNAWSTLAGPDRYGVAVTAEVTPGLWAFSRLPHGPDQPPRRGYAVPLLDANGTVRGASFMSTTPDRGSAFENTLTGTPEPLTWGRHSLFKLPRPMSVATRDSSDEDRDRAHPQEMFVAIAAIDAEPHAEPQSAPADQRIPVVQAFRKAPSWRPFAEDLVLDPAPTPAAFKNGDVRALAVSARIEPEALLRLLAAMANVDPARVLADPAGLAALRPAAGGTTTPP